MLDRIFMQIVKMSFTASIVIAVVLVARLILKKAPKIFSYALWIVVLLRLVCPFSIKSVLSLIPQKANTISQQITPSYTTNTLVSAPPIINTPQPDIDIPHSTTTASAGINWIFVIEIIWIIGIFALLLYSIVSFIKLKKSLKYSVNYRDNIYLAENLKSPFVMGFFRPKIYLPTNLTEDEIKYIILHEQMHIKRFDHIIKIISFLVLCVHWFNPLVWIAFFISGKDMEMSCDERVIKKLGNDVKKDYSISLLSLATGKRIIGGTPLAFGEGNTKSRIKNIISYKKPAFWVIIVCVLAVIAVCVGLMTNPKEKKTDGKICDIYEYRTQYVGDNSKVGGIINNIKYPENIQYKDFELSTDEPPYLLSVNFTTDTKTRNYYSGEINQQPFEIIAVKMFSLIHNVEYINFNLDDGIIDPYLIQFTRDWATDNMETDLWLASESEESFLKFCEDIESKLGDETNQQEFTEILGVSEFDNGDMQISISNLSGVDEFGEHNEGFAYYEKKTNELHCGIITALGQPKPTEGECCGSIAGAKVNWDIDIDKQELLSKTFEPGCSDEEVMIEITDERLLEIGLDLYEYMQGAKNAYKPEKAFNIIMSSPKTSSNSSDYINAHKDEYEKLLKQSDSTLQYIYTEFLNGNQTDLKSQLMMIVAREILGDDEDIDFALSENGTPQDWFNAFHNNAEILYKIEGEDFIKDNLPKTYILIEITILASDSTDNSETDIINKKGEAYDITFPAYQDGKKDYNAFIYNHTPFNVNIKLPDGWSVKLPPKNERKTNFTFTPVYMYKDDVYAGYIGFNTFELYEGTTEENFYRSVYGQLLGNVITWDCDYTPVVEDDNFCAATCKVMERLVGNDGHGAEAKVIYYPAIVAYNKDLLVYTAMQFQQGVVSEEQQTEIAKSISISMP